MATTLESSPETTEKISAASGSAKFWRSCAPQDATGEENWNVWSRHLAKRRSSKAIEQLCDTDEMPLGWGYDQEQFSPATVEMLKLLGKLSTTGKSKSQTLTKSSKKTLSNWLEGSQALPQTIDFAVECLAVAQILPRIAEDVEADTWWGLLDGLWQVAQSATNWRADAELPPEQGLVQQLLGGELPLTLAYLLPEIRPVYKLRTTSHEALSEGLLELLNGDGLPRGTYLGHLRPLVACWTRCRAMGKAFKKGCWSDDAEEQFELLTSHALGLSSALGTPMLGSPNGSAWTQGFLQSLLHLGGDTSDLTAARETFGKKLTRNLKGKQNQSVPEYSEHCEWAGLAYMRTDWDRNAPALAVDFSTPTMRLEAWSGTQRLFSGVWTSETTLDGKALDPVGTWEEVCWFSDEDVDFIELSIDLKGNARLERQILLARDEKFMLLADYVHCSKEGEIRHLSQLPLESEVSFKPEEETREGLLMAKKTSARVLPLALPEWRTDPRVGELSANEGVLQQDVQRPGRNLSCPLFIDLDKSRSSKQCTWRQLTVAQALENQPDDVAAGYRVQCGKQQWLVYRSLDKPANRTVMGQNLSLECLVAKFLGPGGEIDELLEVEG